MGSTLKNGHGNLVVHLQQLLAAFRKIFPSETKNILVVVALCKKGKRRFEEEATKGSSESSSSQENCNRNEESTSGKRLSE